MPKYMRIACLTHSLTTHPFSPGVATLRRPLSTSSITSLTAFSYSDFCNNSRLAKASFICSCNSIVKNLCEIKGYAKNKGIKILRVMLSSNRRKEIQEKHLGNDVEIAF